MKARALGLPLLKVAIRFEHDVVTARQKARKLSQMLGFDNQDQARIATAVSELARNVYQYANSGSIEFFLSDYIPQVFSIKVSDSGPGISDLEAVLAGTYVSHTGMGVGLIGTQKLMDQFQIETGATGTAITIGKLLQKRAKKIDIKTAGKLVEQVLFKPAGTPFEEIQNQNRELLLALEEIRSARTELSQLNEELAETNRGVVALYAELDEKAASLQRANEIKTSFLSNMTHEFRTPLSSIISLTRLLLSKIDGELTEEQQKQVNYIQSASAGLLELVNDLLDLAKVEAGKVSINSCTFQISELLASLRGMFRPLLNGNEAIEMSVECLSETFELNSDQAKISQILRNLVSNAVKFTERGFIRVTCRLEENDLVHFLVSDSGIGIEPKHQEAIFEDFSQVESHLHIKQKGTGLGLPLSRKLARLLGGDLWVESIVGEGSVFHATLPRIYRGSNVGILFSKEGLNTEPAIYDPQLRTMVPSGKFHILLIDDDESSRYLLKKLISQEIDAVFTETENTALGLQVFRKLRPDLVFLDISMPVAEGFAFIQSIKSEGLNEVPIVVNTGKVLSHAEQSFLEENAAAILSKQRSNDEMAISELKAALKKAGFEYGKMQLP